MEGDQIVVLQRFLFFAHLAVSLQKKLSINVAVCSENLVGNVIRGMK